MDIKWPDHKASMSLTHNQHLDYYLTVQQSIDDDDHGYKKSDWVNEEQMQKAIDANECWTIQWYPNSPVGFCILSAYDLDVLLDEASKNNGND